MDNTKDCSIQSNQYSQFVSTKIMNEKQQAKLAKTIKQILQEMNNQGKMRGSFRAIYNKFMDKTQLIIAPMMLSLVQQNHHLLSLPRNNQEIEDISHTPQENLRIDQPNNIEHQEHKEKVLPNNIENVLEDRQLTQEQQYENRLIRYYSAGNIQPWLQSTKQSIDRAKRPLRRLQKQEQQ